MFEDVTGAQPQVNIKARLWTRATFTEQNPDRLAVLNIIENLLRKSAFNYGPGL